MTKNTFVILMQDADHCNKIVTSSDTRQETTAHYKDRLLVVPVLQQFLSSMVFCHNRREEMHLKRIHITPVEVQTKNTWHILGQPLPTNMEAGNLLSIK